MKCFMGKSLLEMQKRILINQEITHKNNKFQEDSSTEDINELIKGLLTKYPKKELIHLLKLKKNDKKIQF